MSERSNTTSSVKKYVMYFSFFMAIFYLISGLIVLLSNKFKIDFIYRILFCAMLMAYGVFRFYRAYKSYQDQHSESI